MTNANQATDEITAKVLSGEAWEEFCDLMKQAGREVLREGVTDPLDVAEGYRMLTRLMRGSLESRIEHGDSLHPELICTCHETIKIVAENPDNLYLGSAINARHDYRLWGTRGDARWLSFNTFGSGGFGGGGSRVGTTLHERELHVEPDGTFELVLSQNEHPGNWLRLEPDATSLAIRQTFLRKGEDEPAELHIERVGDDGSPPAPFGAHRLYTGLVATGHYVRAITAIGASWAERNAEHPNRFADVQEDDTRAFKDPQIAWHQGYFDLADDEALVVEFTPPPCDYWMVCLHNHWMETLDYRHHQCTLNNATAHVEPDGSVRCVVANFDPGVHNWLDCAGHRRGVIGVRWVGENVPDVIPTTRLVSRGELSAIGG